ncbi:hypothetical protein AKJ09_00470 [Labilithrix luteola]|uniref:Outer membrane lipoprotein BamD-like domain-containing protein n=1 Tax=Labilithrix luteola TaxID=1391654 RepID=A0A0K1PK89_9BACT|nr:hypothetical protein [Labilithrix luteola]AKU93806.1 hypothetical protein AKJ09_00470 [Labilithrix luteola]
MIDPPRLLDGASDLERAILESALDDEPSVERRKRVVAGVGVAAAAVAVTSLGSRFASWKLVVGAVSIAAACAVAGIAHSYRADVEVAVASRRIEAPAVESAPPKRALEQPPAPVEEPAPVLVQAPVQTVPARPTVAHPATAPEPSAPSISREILLIDRARTAKAKGHATEALAALDEYERDWPHGALAVEAEVLRIEALAAAGDEKTADEKARAFVDAHPRSPYETRVRAYVKNP